MSARMMRSKPTRLPAFLFDFGGVIVNWRNNDPIYRDVARRYDRSYNLVRRAFINKLGLFESGKISTKSFVDEAFHTLDLNLEKGDSAERLWALPFSQECKPRIATLTLVKFLRRKGYSVYILTNVSLPHLKLLRQMPLAINFDYVFASCELGSVKPEIAIFRKVLKALHVSAHEVVFVDDHIENVHAAKAFGIDRAFQYTSAYKLRRKFEDRLIS